MIVVSELKRRNNCRCGLRGVLVTASNGGPLLRVTSTRWGKEGLIINAVENDDDEAEIQLTAEQCKLASEWPVTCRCWC